MVKHRLLYLFLLSIVHILLILDKMLFGRSEKKPVEPVAPSFEDQLPTVTIKILNLSFLYSFF